MLVEDLFLMSLFFENVQLKKKLGFGVKVVPFWHKLFAFLSGTLRRIEICIL